MKRLTTLAVLCAVLAGCVTEPPPSYVVSGYIRWIDCRYDDCSITFEHETGEITSYKTFNFKPPLWVGLRAEVEMYPHEECVHGDLTHLKRVVVRRRIQ